MVAKAQHQRAFTRFPKSAVPTRMHVDPRRGVVDADGRLHAGRNIYVTGGSVFPTGGYVNPTLTIVALAARLGVHLADRLEGA